MKSFIFSLSFLLITLTAISKPSTENVRSKATINSYSFETICEFINFLRKEKMEDDFAWTRKETSPSAYRKISGEINIKDINISGFNIGIGLFLKAYTNEVESASFEITTDTKQDAINLIKKMQKKLTDPLCGGGMATLHKIFNYESDDNIDIVFGDNLSGFSPNSLSIRPLDYGTGIYIQLEGNQDKGKYFYILQKKSNKDFHLTIRNIMDRCESGDLNLYKNSNSGTHVSEFKNTKYETNVLISGTTENHVIYPDTNDEEPFYAGLIDVSKLTTEQAINDLFLKWKQYCSYALGDEYYILQEYFRNGEAFSFINKTTDKKATLKLIKVKGSKYITLKIVKD